MFMRIACVLYATVQHSEAAIRAFYEDALVAVVVDADASVTLTIVFFLFSK